MNGDKMKNDLEQIKAARAEIQKAKNILVITGAGISAESGLPTYRGVSGLYNSGIVTEGISIEEAISGPVLHQNPEITWKYLLQIEKGCREAKPNAAHIALAKLEQEGKRVVILTQNIDGFHHQAGSSNIIDIHGDLYDIKCMSCSFEKRVTSYEQFEANPLPPLCPACAAKRSKGVLRPKVVLFEEMLEYEKLARLEEEKQKGFDLVLTIGTTSVFPYIAGPVKEAHRRGTPTIEINPDPTEVSFYCDYKLRCGAVEVLGE